MVVALTGGIACYKTATLVSRLAQRDNAVRVLMTEAATRFIGPLTLQSLSGSPVVTSIWPTPPRNHVADCEVAGYEDGSASPHIALARWCELMIVAPASANILAKLAHGFTDDVVTLVAAALPPCSRRPDGADAARPLPLLVAPAMNARMWENPVVQRNLAAVRDVLGARVVGPESGWQACRTTGPGRMAEPETILDAAAKLLSR